MTFEFDYDIDAEQITIVYDGSCVLKVNFDGEKPVFKNFEKLKDEEVENLLKTFCKNVHAVLA